MSASLTSGSPALLVTTRLSADEDHVHCPDTGILRGVIRTQFRQWFLNNPQARNWCRPLVTWFFRICDVLLAGMEESSIWWNVHPFIA